MRLRQGVNRMSGKIVEAHRSAPGEAEEGGGCAFIIDSTDPGRGPVNFCNAPRGAGSTYCLRHHALCHLTKGSAAEERQLREIEVLAGAVGGRQGIEARHPPDR